MRGGGGRPLSLSPSLWQNPPLRRREGSLCAESESSAGASWRPAHPISRLSRTNLASTESWLAPFNGFGPDNFLVGVPQFSFADYRDWIAHRFPPARFHQLEEKMDLPVLYAIGSFIQALGQNPGLEEELRGLGTAAHIYMGTGVGCVETISRQTRSLDRAQRRWDRFWAERNPAYQALDGGEPPEGAPPRPETIADSEDRYEAEAAWWHFWAASSPDLRTYLAELAEIESLDVQGDIEKSKVSVMKEKQRRLRHMHETWSEPHAALAVRLAQLRVEHLEHAGLADLHARAHHGPGLRAGRRLLHLRRLPEARDGRHPPRRGQGRGDRRHRSAAAPSHRGRLLLRPRDLGRRLGLQALDRPARHPRGRRLRPLDPRRLSST